jgi:hypothetical protein
MFRFLFRNRRIAEGPTLAEFWDENSESEEALDSRTKSAALSTAK